MKEASYVRRTIGAFVWSLVAASIGFGIGMAGRCGPLGAFLFPFLLPAVAVFVGPGTALIALVVTAYVDKRSGTARTPGELWRAGLFLAVPLALLNILLSAMAVTYDRPDNLPEFFRHYPLAFPLSGLWGAAGIVFGTLRGLRLGRTT